MKRILLVGCSGAGKSTLSRKLADITKLPLYHLDKLHWLPGWTEPDHSEWLKIVKEHIAKDEWIIDGNYIHTMEMRAERADTIIFFDFPTVLCLYRVLKRILSKKPRLDAPAGCPEVIDLKFFLWIATFRGHTIPRINKILKAQEAGKKIFILHNRKEVDKFTEEFNKTFKNIQ